MQIQPPDMECSCECRGHPTRGGLPAGGGWVFGEVLTTANRKDFTVLRNISQGRGLWLLSKKIHISN